MHYFVIDLYLV